MLIFYKMIHVFRLSPSATVFKISPLFSPYSSVIIKCGYTSATRLLYKVFCLPCTPLRYLIYCSFSSSVFFRDQNPLQFLPSRFFQSFFHHFTIFLLMKMQQRSLHLFLFLSLCYVHRLQCERIHACIIHAGGQGSRCRIKILDLIRYKPRFFSCTKPAPPHLQACFPDAKI